MLANGMTVSDGKHCKRSRLAQSSWNKQEMRGWRATEKVILGMTLEFWGGACSWKIS
jgi:hypothetical protein